MSKWNAAKGFLSWGKSKVSPTITSVKISPNLKGKFEAKQDIFKTVDKAAGPNVSGQKKSKIKIEAGKKVSARVWVE